MGMDSAFVAKPFGDVGRGEHASSEYQYKEFPAPDRPLAREEQNAVRSLSARARITATATGFTNEHQWGNFGGDPLKLMERHFDAYLRMAN